MIRKLSKARCPALGFILGICAVFLLFPSASFYSQHILFSEKTEAFHNLEGKIKEEILQWEGDASFLLRDIVHPGFKIAFDENKNFPAASLIKLPLTAVACAAIAEGRFSLAQPVVIRKKDVVGGSGVVKGMKLPLELTFGKVLELVIAHSDNTATNKLIELLGVDYVNEGFAKLGLPQTLLVRKMMDFSRRGEGIDNYTTAADICFLLERICKGELINKEYSALILSFLQAQKVNDRLPRYLPPGIEVAHKTGLEKGVVHDAGIIFSPKGNYIICVLTREVKSYAKAKKFIAKLSLLTYNFYQ